MPAYEATVRVTDPQTKQIKEFVERVYADNPQEARRLLEQRYGRRGVPYIPHIVPA